MKYETQLSITGLMRDYFTHKITTPEHWRMLMMPTVYTAAELDYNVVVGPDTVVEPSYDPHCANGDISGGCRPVLVVSAEVLRDHTLGASETQKIANLISSNAKMAPYVIDSEVSSSLDQKLLIVYNVSVSLLLFTNVIGLAMRMG